MLLNTLQCTGRPHHRNHPALNVSSAQVEGPRLSRSHSPSVPGSGRGGWKYYSMGPSSLLAPNMLPGTCWVSLPLWRLALGWDCWDRIFSLC